MKARFAQLVCVAFLAGFLGSQFADNSIQTQANEKKVEKKADEKKTRKKPRGRLPNYYSKVVNKKQREEIYSLQEQYSEQIESLTKQIDDLKTKMNEECRELLSDEQKKKVDDLSAAAKKKSDDKKKAKDDK
jgi:hypothetical protein